MKKIFIYFLFVIILSFNTFTILPAYAEFKSDHIEIKNSTKIIEYTPGYNKDGTTNDLAYNNDVQDYYTVTVPNAISLNYTVKYSTENNYDWVAVGSGTFISSWNSTLSSFTIPTNYTAKTGVGTHTGTITGDTLEVYWRTGGSVTNKGYWLEIIPVYSPGTGVSDVNMSLDGVKINVTIPSTLSFVFNSDGSTTTPSNFMISNNKPFAPVRLKTVKWVSSNGWQIVNNNTDFSTIPAQSKQLAVKINTGEEQLNITENTLQETNFTIPAGIKNGENITPGTNTLSFEVKHGTFNNNIISSTAASFIMDFDWLEKTLGDYSLQELKNIANDISSNGSNSQYYAKFTKIMNEGQTIDIPLNITNGQSITIDGVTRVYDNTTNKMRVRIVDINNVNNGITFMAANALLNGSRMNPSGSSGDWNNSELKTRLNSGVFYNMFTTELKNLAKNTTRGKFFLATVNNTHADTSDTAGGGQFTYFKNKNITISNYLDIRVINQSIDGKVYHGNWWMSSGSGNWYRSTNSNGYAGGQTASDVISVVPCFVF